VEQPKPLIDLRGISSQAASRYQALADVPKDLIEQAFRDPVVKPSTRAIALSAG
jgi:hypothetical protein